MAWVVVRRAWAGRPRRKSAIALPVMPPENVRSPLGRLMNAIFIFSCRMSSPNFHEWRPRSQVKSSVNWKTLFTRSTNGCCESPRVLGAAPKKPATAIEARPGASGLVLGRLMPYSEFSRPLVTAGLA